MKQRFTKLLAAVALLVFMMPTMAGWGQTKDEIVAYTLQPASGSNNSYTGNCDITISGVTWNLEGNSQQIPWRIGGKSISNVDRKLYSKTAIADNISKIEVTHGAASSITVNSWTVIVASDADFTNVVSTLTPTFVANATTTINRPDGKDWSNCYYRFVYNVTVSGSSNKFVEFSQAKFYKESDGPQPEKYTVTYAAGEHGSGTMTDSNEYVEGDEVTLLSNNFEAEEGYEWSSWLVEDADNNEITVTNGKFEMPGSDVTVTAQWEAIGPNFTYVFSDATKFYTDAALNTNVPTGNTSSVGTFYYENGDMFTAAGTNHYFGAGGNNYFFIGKTGATLTLPTYEGYKITRIIIHNSSGCSQSVSVEVANGTNTASNAQTWTVRNQDYTYNIDAAYQTSALTVKITNDYNAQITSITVVREEINANRVATPTFNPNGGIITEDTDVTISCETEGATIYYTLDGSTPTTDSDVYEEAIPVSVTTTIKAIAVKSGMDNSYEAEASYTRKYIITVNETTGGTITASPLQAEEGDPITLTATPGEGYTFGEWSITPNVSMNGNIFEMPASNVTVSATFNQRPSFTITFTTNGINDGSMQVYQGDAVGTLPEATAEYIPAGYTFVGWYNGDITEPIQTAPSFISPADPVNSDLTLKAVFAIASGSGSSDTYALVSDVNDLNNGDIIILVSTGSYNYSGSTYNFTVANGTVNSDKLMDPVDVTISENKVTSTDVAPITLVEVTGGWKLQMGTQYLKNVAGQNQIVLDNEGAINTITISSNNATIGGITDNTDTRNIYYNPNNGNGRFAYYKSKQKDISIYKQESSVTYSNYCTSVTETFELPITGYTNGGGWNLIASPVVSINPVNAGMITDEFVSTNVTPENGTYDLYRFNQSAELEWENYRVHSFALESGKGYLYASKEGVSIQFAGAPYNSGEIPLVYDAGKDFAGWNLIGNPFGVAATLDMPYYRMNDNQTTLGAKIEGGQIAAMEGVFVYAYDTEHEQAIETATFTRAGRSNNAPQGFVNLNVEQNASVVDNVIVRFDEGRSLPKLQLFKGVAEIFITKNGKDYAIVSSEAQNEMPVNFKAQKNGTYTLNVDTENVEMNYLHLIDNMTGMDVDLLQTPSYTFDATTNDYASRFRLVFSANNVDGPSAGSEAFAFYSNGNWVVGNEGEATLQVIDVNGRIVSNETINGTVATSINATPGVYMLRLVNGNEVKTQKIVVR